MLFDPKKVVMWAKNLLFVPQKVVIWAKKPVMWAKIAVIFSQNSEISVAPPLSVIKKNEVLEKIQWTKK